MCCASKESILVYRALLYSTVQRGTVEYGRVECKAIVSHHSSFCCSRKQCHTALLKKGVLMTGRKKMGSRKRLQPDIQR